MALTPEELCDRLNTISISNGIAYGRAYSLFGEEQKYREQVLQYKGYLALSDAFKCFFLETADLVNSIYRVELATPLSEQYPLFVHRLVHAFQSLCGTERLAICGYPYQAYSLLRNTFDNILLTSAALLKLTDFYSIEGMTPGEPIDYKKIKKMRKNTEFDVRKQMLGSDSGLKQYNIDALKKWDDFFDLEVHGARLSLADAQGWLSGQEPLPILPAFKERKFAMFKNRYSEIGWMVHRLVPALLPPTNQFSENWKEKWRILDESFHEMVYSHYTQFGSETSVAIVELVQRKFPFNEQSAFPL